MYLEELGIKNFGPISEFQHTFNPKGITIICGPNGSGKTHIIGAILFTLFDMKSVTILPNGKVPCEVYLQIRDKEKKQIIRNKI